MRAVVFTGSGGREVIAVMERPEVEPAGEEVLVAVRYAGLNPADLAQRAGSYPAPAGVPSDIPGIEVAGTVVACGPAATEHPPGTRVFGIVGGGGLAERVLVHQRHVTRVPEALDEQAAAAVPEVFVTAHDAICTQGKVGLGDVLVVNGANGGVGTAAVQIGLAAGAHVIATVRSPELRERVAALGAHAIAPDELVVTARAAGGADVVLELVGAPNIAAAIDCLAARGRIVVVGTGGGAEATIDLRRLMARRVHLIGTVLRARTLEEKAAAVQAFRHEVVPFLADGRMRPLVDAVFPIEQVADAYDRLEAPGKLGKVLLDLT